MRLPFAGAILALAVALVGPALVFGLGSRAGLTSVPSAAAQSSNRSVSSPRYDADLQLQQGGDVLVRETIQIAFQGGPFRTGYRRIPLDRLEGVSDVRVEQTGPDAQAYRPGREQPYTFAVSGQTRGGGAGSGDLVVEWWFPPTTNATRTFVVSYRAQGAVRFYDGGDQLYWNVTGNERAYAIQSSTVTLRMPPGLTVPQSGWMTDLYPRQYQRQKAEAGESVTWQASGIPADTAFEVRAQWPHGLISGTPPSWQVAADAEDVRRETLAPVLTLAFGGLAVLLPLVGGLFVLLRWYSGGRDPSIGVVPKELDSPPSDLPPALVGTVVDEHADVQDVIATVLDLAARGDIAIREVADGTLAGGSRDFELELLRDRKEIDPQLRPYERMVLDSFFTRGPQVRLAELGGWFQFAVPRIAQQLHKEVKDAGLFRDDPDAVRRRNQRLGNGLIVAGLLLGVVTCGVTPSYAGAVMWPFFSLALVGVLLRVMATRMPQRTAAGALEAARWRAYGRYLAREAPERLALPVAPGRAPAATRGADGLDGASGRDDGADAEAKGEVFERALPYAVALGLARTWVDKFSQAGTTTPRWLEPPVVVAGGPMWGGPMGRSYRRGRGRGRVFPGPMYPGFPGMPGPWIGGGAPGGRGDGAGSGGPGGSPQGDGAGGGGLQGSSDSAAGGLEHASGSLADLLNAASEVLSRGGGGGWSGGGHGGGSFGGGGGGSGGGGSGFS